MRTRVFYRQVATFTTACLMAAFVSGCAINLKQNDVFKGVPVTTSKAETTTAQNMYQEYVATHPIEKMGSSLDELDKSALEKSVRGAVETYLRQNMLSIDAYGLPIALRCELENGKHVIAIGGRNIYGFKEHRNYSQSVVNSKLSGNELTMNLAMSGGRGYLSTSAKAEITSRVDFANGVASLNSVNVDPSCKQSFQYNNPMPCEIAEFALDTEILRAAIVATNPWSCSKNNLDTVVSQAVKQCLDSRFVAKSQMIKSKEVMLPVDYTTALSRLQRSRMYTMRFEKDTNSFVFSDKHISIMKRDVESKEKVSHQIFLYPDKDKTVFIVETTYSTFIDSYTDKDLANGVATGRQQDIVKNVKSIISN